MLEDSVPDRPTLLERLDLALAGRVAERLANEDSGPELVAQSTRVRATEEDRHGWVSGLLLLRGFRVGRDDVARIVNDGPGRFRPEHQEFKLVRGLAATVAALEERAADGAAPDGWWLVQAFRSVTEDLGRFRGNVLRRDQPWDGLLRVDYPEPEQVSKLLDAFHEDQCFGDRPEVFAGLHPVRQGVRAMWRFARIAPFPDFNLCFAALAFGGYLLAKGYPPLLPANGDRVRLERLVRGPIPLRALPVEARLLDQVEAARSGTT